ncbi:MAG: hypothetical protein GF350_06430 [Chitinivibrionales bacterium]|nr:hypothetical protein [Chitinivibrionales bacterium]
MSDNETEALRQELDHYRAEKEKIRSLVGQIGGRSSQNVDKTVNFIFIAAILALFILDFLRYLAGIHMPLPPLVSLELGLLMVSIKIIWMMHKQAKVEHFQFWILNSIEFRLTTISKKIESMEKINRTGN